MVILVPDTDDGEGCALWGMGKGAGTCGNSLYMPLNLAANLKLLYKIKSIFKNVLFR